MTLEASHLPELPSTAEDVCKLDTQQKISILRHQQDFFAARLSAQVLVKLLYVKTDVDTPSEMARVQADLLEAWASRLSPPDITYAIDVASGPGIHALSNISNSHYDVVVIEEGQHRGGERGQETGGREEEEEEYKPRASKSKKGTGSSRKTKKGAAAAAASDVTAKKPASSSSVTREGGAHGRELSRYLRHCGDNLTNIIVLLDTVDNIDVQELKQCGISAVLEQSSAHPGDIVRAILDVVLNTNTHIGQNHQNGKIPPFYGSSVGTSSAGDFGLSYGGDSNTCTLLSSSSSSSTAYAGESGSASLFKSLGTFGLSGTGSLLVPELKLSALPSSRKRNRRQQDSSARHDYGNGSESGKGKARHRVGCSPVTPLSSSSLSSSSASSSSSLLSTPLDEADEQQEREIEQEESRRGGHYDQQDGAYEEHILEEEGEEVESSCNLVETRRQLFQKGSFSSIFSSCVSPAS